MKNILVLFPKDWDRLHFAQPQYRDGYRFFYEGFDLFTFPENARLIGFNIFRFVDGLLAKYRRIGLDAIISNNEQFGALIASLLAERLELPRLNSRTVITAQHKFYTRERLRTLTPALVSHGENHEIREIPGRHLPCHLRARRVCVYRGYFSCICSSSRDTRGQIVD